jgi:hypothetical protein
MSPVQPLVVVVGNNPPKTKGTFSSRKQPISPVSPVSTTDPRTLASSIKPTHYRKALLSTFAMIESAVNARQMGPDPMTQLTKEARANPTGLSISTNTERSGYNTSNPGLLQRRLPMQSFTDYLQSLAEATPSVDRAIWKYYIDQYRLVRFGGTRFPRFTRDGKRCTGRTTGDISADEFRDVMKCVVVIIKALGQSRNTQEQPSPP